MNTIRNDFPKNVKLFFISLQNYLDTKLYFYGSVNRNDYIHNQSDIDVAIFTNNEYSMMSKLQHFLHVQKNAFDKIVWKLNDNMIYGYKIKCHKHLQPVEHYNYFIPKNLKCEITIYNTQFKPLLLKDMQSGNKIPIHIDIILNILKMFYYTIPILPKNIYNYIKRIIFNDIVTQKDTVFYLIKQTDDESDESN